MGRELASQPDCWRRAAEVADEMAGVLPQPGERVAVIGCGTSWFMAMSYAALREASGGGVTDAFSGSEVPEGRTYDRVVVISRSGTTSEIVELLRRIPRAGTLAISAVTGSPVVTGAEAAIALPFADEESVVQTRFATSALALLRASVGESIERAAQDAEVALERDLDSLLDAEQFAFIGRGWVVGLAHEAALKMREAAQFWTESYPSMDYRHGPIAIAQPRRVVWSLDEPPAGLGREIAATGATFIAGELDPMAELVAAQRTALAIAQRRNLDPDNPRHLTRSVLLENAGS
jgi:fructoselysine-6-P-deglycase FrlB-like protein